MKGFRRLGALAIIAVAAFAVAGVQDYKLRSTPKVGEVLKYRLSGELSLMGQTVEMLAVSVNKTLKVEPNGSYTVESSMTDGKIVINGSEMDLPEQPASTTTYKADGSVIELSGEAAELGGGRMANLMAFVVPDKPYKVGDTWTTETKADKSKSTVGVAGKYTFEAVEKNGDVDTAKVTFEVKESEGDTPARISGTAWIDVKTGNAVSVVSTWTSVPIPGAPEPVNGKMSMTLLR